MDFPTYFALSLLRFVKYVFINRCMYRVSQKKFVIELPALGFAQSQGGRSCTGARVAPAEKFGLGRKF